MPAKDHKIVVIVATTTVTFGVLMYFGISAGGLDALDALVSQLPADLPAAIFIVQHVAPESTRA